MKVSDYRGGDRRLCGYVPRPTCYAEWFELVKLAAERFWSKVQKGTPDECWPWLESVNDDGYGRIKITAPGNTPRAQFEASVHRVAWELTHGRPVAEGMVVRHSCDNPPCCNPAHLIEGTQADNVDDRERRGRSYRKLGEEAPRAVLTEALVHQIRDMTRAGMKRSEIRDALGVSWSAVDGVVRGKFWQHIKNEATEEAAQ